MAVALSLADLRATNPTEVKRAPSLLHSPVDASKIPLAEQAALAANSLSLLSTIDPELPNFIDPLYLSRPTTRQTLDSASQVALSASVVDLARRLSPLFPVRHAQRVLEWLVNALQAGLLASETELDALLVSALPFHATPQFSTFAAALLLSRPLPRWLWLKPVAEQRLSPSPSYLTEHCPCHVHELAIGWANSLATHAVPTTAATSFLASVTARWVPSASPEDRRAVLLKALVALEKAIELPPQYRDEVISAFLTVAAAAIVAGLDEDVAPVMGKCLVRTVRRCEGDVRTSALVCLSLLIKRHGQKSLTPSSSIRLLRADLSDILKRLGEKSQALCNISILCTLSRDVPSLRMLRTVTDVIDKFGKEFLIEKTVTEFVKTLLDLVHSALQEIGSSVVDHFGKPFSQVLGSLLSLLARREFGASFDEGLRSHCEGRPPKPSSEKRQDALDQFLLAALSGTTFEAENTMRKKSLRLCGPALLSALLHPSDNIRIIALKQMISNGVPEDANQEVVKERLKAMLEVEQSAKILGLVSKAAAKLCAGDKAQLLRMHCRGVLRILGTSGPLDSPTSNQLSRQFLNFCSSLIPSKPECVLGAIIAVLCSTTKGKSFFNNSVSLVRKVVISAVGTKHSFKEELSTFNDGTDLEEDIWGVVELLPHVQALRKTELLWEVDGMSSKALIPLLKHWVPVLKQTNKSKPMVVTPDVSDSIIFAFKSFIASSSFVLARGIITETVGLLLDEGLPESLRHTRATALWGCVIAKQDTEAIHLLLSALNNHLGVASTMGLLKAICLSDNDQQVRGHAFTWYFYLVRTLGSKEHESSLIKVALILLYGEDETLRKKARQICSVQSHISVLEGIAFLQSNISFSQQFMHNFTQGNDIGSFIRLQLETEISLLHERKRNLPCALVCSQASEREFQNFSEKFYGLIEPKNNGCHQIAVLRAWRGVPLPSEDHVRSACECLHSELLRLMESIEWSDTQIERFILLLHSLLNNIKLGTGASYEKLSKHETFTRINVLLQKSKSESVSPLHRRAIEVSITGLLVLLYGATGEAKEDALSQLLLQSSQSTNGGALARRAVDSLCAAHIKVDELLPALQGLCNMFESNQRKKPRSTGTQKKKLRMEDVSLGALEAVGRIIQTGKIPGSHDGRFGVGIETVLWTFIKQAMHKSKEGMDAVEEGVQYRLTLALNIVRGLYLANPHVGEKSSSIDFQALVDATFYAHSNEHMNEAATVTSVRRSAQELIEVIAPYRSSDLRSVAEPLIANLLTAKNLTRSFRVLRGLVPCLLASGCSFEKVVTWLCQTGFTGSRKTEEMAPIRQLLSSSCKTFEDIASKVLLCINTIWRLFDRDSQIDEVTTQCSSLVTEADIDVEDMFMIIAQSPTAFRCRFAVAVLSGQSFQLKLQNFLNHHTDQSFRDALCSMYSSILSCPHSPQKEQATQSIISILPFEGLCECTKKCLEHKNNTVVLEAIKAFSIRLQEDHRPIQATWASTYGSTSAAEVKEASGSILEVIGNALCQLLQTQFRENEVQKLIKQESVAALERLVTRLGDVNTEAVMSFATYFLSSCTKTVSDIKSSKSKETKNALRWYLAMFINCLASFLSVLREKAVSIIPMCLDLSITLLRNAFTGNEAEKLDKKSMRTFVKVTEGAVKLCTSIFESTPSMFGQRALKTLACLGMSCSADVLEDLLIAAIEAVPAATAMGALISAAGELRSSDATADGVRVLLNVLKKAAETFSKSRMKLHSGDILAIMLNCLAHGRRTEEFEKVLLGNSMDVDSFENWLSDCQVVDEGSAEAMCAVVLRLTEVEFKPLFESFEGWCGKGQVGREVEETLPEKERALLRTIPRYLSLYRVSLRLFQELQVIFVPYFFREMDNTLAILSFKRSSLKSEDVETGSKKRKRGRVRYEEENKVKERYNKICSETQDAALNCVTQLLKQETSTSLLSGEAVTRIVNAALIYLDEHEEGCDRVSQCLAELARRIVDIGNVSETKDDSRSLLSTLAREILRRTQENREWLREAALLVSEAIATEIGDEYLVTLPESMPVLAEVIDDESDAVKKAAKSFAERMGALAGEPILDQLQ